MPLLCVNIGFSLLLWCLLVSRRMRHFLCPLVVTHYQSLCYFSVLYPSCAGHLFPSFPVFTLKFRVCELPGKDILCWHWAMQSMSLRGEAVLRKGWDPTRVPFYFRQQPGSLPQAQRLLIRCSVKTTDPACPKDNPLCVFRVPILM